jgi:hypothetical protein
MVKKGLGYFIAYLMWVVTMALGLWFALISRNGFLDLLARAVQRSVMYPWQTSFYDKVYSLALGLLWLAFMIVVERYFRRGVEQGDLIRRVAQVVGPELLLIFVADLGLLVLGGVGSTSWLRWVILGGEVVGGVLLLLYARSLRRPKPGRAEPAKSA